MWHLKGRANMKNTEFPFQSVMLLFQNIQVWTGQKEVCFEGSMSDFDSSSEYPIAGREKCD